MKHSKSLALGISFSIASIFFISIILMSLTSCSKSGQRAKQLAKAPPTWEISDSQGDNSYDPITLNQVQDYLVLGFWIYSPTGETSLHLDDYDRYEIINVEAVHSGIVSFDKAFKLFYELYCPKMSSLDYFTLKRQAAWLTSPPIQLPVD